MKFNKSTESDFWYVEGNDSYYLGKIKFMGLVDGYVFCPNANEYFYDSDLDQISAKIKELNRESGIDTTSTFKSNSGDN